MADYKAIKLIQCGTEYCFGDGGGSGGYDVDVLVVAGGGGGASATCVRCMVGGGGAGGVIYKECYMIPGAVPVMVGDGAAARAANSVGYKGCNSAFGHLIAEGGGYGSYLGCGGDGGSGGGAGGYYCCTANYGGLNAPLQGGMGGYRVSHNTCACCTNGGGGGGAGSGGCGYEQCPGVGGAGITSNIDGDTKCYAGGGGGGSDGRYGHGQYGGGDATATIGCPGTTCGSGGGAGRNCGGAGAKGIVVVRYPTACGYDMTGGTKYTCGNYTIHCFCNSGILKPSGSDGCYIEYLVVGGGGGGWHGGGGGGAVCAGYLELKNSSLNIIVGVGGAIGTSGGLSRLNYGDGCITANGGEFGYPYNEASGYGKGGASGSGFAGGCYSDIAPCNCCGKGGGGGAGGAGANGCGVYGGLGGFGVLGYGGGGGGGATCTTRSNMVGCILTERRNVAGGGKGWCNTLACNTPTNCGGGGGGAYNCACSGAGACGVVDICYACDGSRGINSATGGNSCYLCGDICVHRFTQSGTFTVTG